MPRGLDIPDLISVSEVVSCADGQQEWHEKEAGEIETVAHYTFWCNFRLGVERTVNVKVDKLVDRRLIWNALAQLGRGLNHNVRANRSMTINDLKLMIETTLTTTEMAFRLGEIRILTVLFLLLPAPQGSRPAAILQLQFKHRYRFVSRS